MAKPKNYDPGLHGTINDEPSLTQQSYLQESDINHIMKRYTQTGLLPPGTAQAGHYGDFSTVTDYMTAIHLVENAQAQLDQLPAEARLRFLNDPYELLDMVDRARQGDANALTELTSLGLLQKEQPVAPPAAAPTTPGPGSSPDAAKPKTGA